MNPQILNYAKAGFSGIVVVSHEESRVEQDLYATAQSLGYEFFVWSATEGVQCVSGPEHIHAIADTDHPSAMLAAFMRRNEAAPPNWTPATGFSKAIVIRDKALLVCRDFHAFTGPDAPPTLVRQLRDALNIGKQCQRVLVMLGCKLNLPPEIEKEVAVVEFKLPNRAELLVVLQSIATEAGVKLKTDEIDTLLDAASGMTSMEAEAAFALSVAETKAFKPEIIHREKSATVKKNGLLEIVESRTGMNDIGGLDNLKRDLHEKRHLFTKQAKEFGLPTPRGILACGQPGTGKSLTAAATANIFGLPLVKLEAGRLFGSLVGQSEANWRSAFATVKAIAPCILWIDEVDGLFSGGGSSTDGGTTQRVLKAILQDMQFNGEDVFFMFTANDIDQLPDPLIDRLDVWSVDLPTQSERVAIWRIHITKRGRKAKSYDLEELAALTEGFSGRQIEQVWLKAMTLAFNDSAREPDMDDCRAAIARVTPTSKTMATQIEARRERLKNRATPASAAEEPKTAAKPVSGGRKIAA